jgi:hypothetical protein
VKGGYKGMIVDSKPCPSGTTLAALQVAVTEGHPETFLRFYCVFKYCFFSRPIVTGKEKFLIA